MAPYYLPELLNIQLYNFKFLPRGRGSILPQCRKYPHCVIHGFENVCWTKKKSIRQKGFF